jgi:chemotaxis protein methyltransferase CheR
MDAEMSVTVSMRDETDIELKLLLDAIFLKYHYDFRHYAAPSMKRRVLLALPKLGCTTISSLQERVLRDPDLFSSLLSTLTVRVSSFFRDAGYFRTLRERVVPYLRTYPSLRVWIAGCADGEEVYSVAIVLEEEGLLDRTQIYATDINPDGLRRAEAGVYHADRVPQMSDAYHAAGGRRALVDYYTAAYDSVLLDRRLRRNVVFSDHSLTTDGVFAEVQLISCRNVLIYFDRALQDRAFGLFRDALCHHGFLGLGARETVEFSAHADAFKPFAPQDRIFQRR